MQKGKKIINILMLKWINTEGSNSNNRVIIHEYFVEKI